MTNDCEIDGNELVRTKINIKEFQAELNELKAMRAH